MAEARVSCWTRRLRLRLVRAPISGRIESVVELQPGLGGRGRARAWPASSPPAGCARWRFYDPSTSVGRVRAGQRARLRLLGFPWTKYGSIPATVNRVGNEPKDGQIRVELLLRPRPASASPCSTGCRRAAEIEVERVSPASLVLDSAGRFLTSGADEHRAAARSRARGRSAGAPPEVIQTSAMDCGPAALKCLLEGFGHPRQLRPPARGLPDRGRRHLDRHAGGAGRAMLGLEAEQITLPVENLLLPAAAALPALVVVTLALGR